MFSYERIAPYNFLILALLFTIPSLIIFFLRSDLRKMMGFLAFCSIPFAFTERFFYPSYWEPKFIFDLIHIFGFGLEDILFVIGLSGFSSTSYLFLNRKKFNKYRKKSESILFNFILVSILIIFSVALFLKLDLHLIFGAPLLMMGLFGLISSVRRDLFFPGIVGGIYCFVTYSILCYILLFLYPNIFELTWHTEKFLNIKILSIPLEEILYAFTTGCIATVFYPYLFQKQIVSIREFDKKKDLVRF